MPSIPAEEATAVDAVKEAKDKVLQDEQDEAAAHQKVVDSEATLKIARNTLRLVLGAAVLPMLVAVVLCIGTVGVAIGYDLPRDIPTEPHYATRQDEPCAAYNAAVAESQRTGKPLLVLVCADWCKPCRDLLPLYPQLRFKGIFIHIDAVVHRSLVTALRVAGSIPRLIIWHHIKGHWQHRVLVGADAIKEYARDK